MRRKNGRILPACVLAFFLFFLTGCGGTRFENAYETPENGLIQLVDLGNGNFPGGFAKNLCVPESESDINPSDVDAAAFGLFSLSDGRVISQHNVYNKVYPASVTKVLTCLIALEYGNLEEAVTVPDEADITVSGSSMAGLKPGDTLSLGELLYGLMVPSGNDAAVAISCHISGSTGAFAELMNEKAGELGAACSHFTNPHGLPDEDHYTTVYDMYLIFNEAMKFEKFREIAGTSSYTCTINDEAGSANEEREVTWTSSNGFYKERYYFADNMEIVAAKTGHTSAAGYCLALGAEGASGKEYISIIFNAPLYDSLYEGMVCLNEKSGE